MAEKISTYSVQVEVRFDWAQVMAVEDILPFVEAIIRTCERIMSEPDPCVFTVLREELSIVRPGWKTIHDFHLYDRPRRRYFIALRRKWRGVVAESLVSKEPLTADGLKTKAEALLMTVRASV